MSRFSTRAAELSERLAQNAQAVCRHYLPAGRREGRYWMVGDIAGAPGRSLYVRLFETERGAIGNWVDAATGERGDLVDLIRINQRHGRLSETIDEAERFLSLPSSSTDEQSRFVEPLRLWIAGVVIFAIGHAVSVWAARRDPQFVDVARRHLRFPTYLRV